MIYVPIDKVFNYIPSNIRKKHSDDDELLSWALRAFRKLNFPTERYVSDIDFQLVQNHKAKRPPLARQIKSIDVMARNSTEEELLALNDTLVLPANDSFAIPCNINCEAFLLLDFFLKNWDPVRKVDSLSKGYLCKVANGECKDVYCPIKGTDILEFSFLEGIIAIRYYKDAVDEKNRPLIPEEPDSIWEYMGAFAVREYWENRDAIGEQGASQKLEKAMLKTYSYYSAASRSLIYRNMSINVHNELIYGQMRFAKLPQMIHRLFSSRFLTNAGSLL